VAEKEKQRKVCVENTQTGNLFRGSRRKGKSWIGKGRFVSGNSKMQGQPQQKGRGAEREGTGHRRSPHALQGGNGGGAQRA